MEGSKKRRVAHVGSHASKKKCTEINDLVTDIMKDMDATIAASGNQEIYNAIKSTSHEKDASQCTHSMPSGSSNRPNISSSLPKKFRTAKCPSLMEKVRKNISYIKHNRSLPKPRAHLGGLHDTAKGNTKKERDDIFSTRSSPLLKSQKKSCNSTKIRQNISNCNAESTYSDESSNDLSSSSSHLLKTQKTSWISDKFRQQNMTDCDTENNLSDQSVSDDSSKCNKLLVSSSDSEAEYESFIRAQKQCDDVINHSKSRKKKKLKKKHLSKHKNNVKQKKPAKVEKQKLVELENVENKISRKKHYNTNITAKVSLPNRVQLESSDSSADEKELSDQLLKTGEASSMPSVKTSSFEVISSEQINASNFMCSVRIERNPSLEKTVSLLKTPLEDCEEDCIIVCEVAKSNNHTVDNCIAESGLIESNIQILNVVSLGECEEVTNMNNGNAISNTSSSSCDRNLGEINFEKLREAIEITKVLEGYSNVASFNEETLSPEVNNSNSGFVANVTADSVQNIAYYDSKGKACLSVPKSIIEAVCKIDFKQVLSLTNSESKNPYLSEVKEFNSLPCSSSYSESQPSLMMSRSIPGENGKVIPENHWQNLKKALTMNNFQDELGSTSELSEISFGDDLVKSYINRNPVDKLKTSSQQPSTINPDLNLSYLREILSNATSSRNNNFQHGDTDRFPLKKDYYEDPCDELDALSAASARDLCQNQSSPNFLKLFSLFNQACQDYSGMKDHERHATMGLKLLEENKRIKRRYLETTIEHVLKHDPCLYSTTTKHEETINNNSNKRNLVQSSESEDASAEIIKNCNNCGSKSTIECGRCKKVSFCTEKCGTYYWEKGHYKECDGRQEHT